jgi:hypothetical protein
MSRCLPVFASVLSIAAPAAAEFWVISNHQGDFASIAAAMMDQRVRDGDTFRILSGSYEGFDTGDLAMNIEPGNSPGIVNFSGPVRVRSNSQVNFEIGGLNSGLPSGTPDFDQFIVNGNVLFEGRLGIRLVNAFSPSFGDSWALIQSSGSITFSGLTDLPTLSAGLSWNIAVVSGSSEFGGSGSSLVASVVPAPGAAALVGLAGIIGTRRRR